MVSIPRLETLESIRPDVAAMLRPRAERLGYLGEFFQVAAHQPDALTDFYKLTEHLKEALSSELTEVVALTVATRTQNVYERHQHEWLCRKLGFPDPWIQEVERLEPSTASLMSAAQSAAQKFALDALVAYGRGAKLSLDVLIETIGAAESVAVLFLVGRYLMHATIVHALELAPPVSSPFDAV